VSMSGLPTVQICPEYIGNTGTLFQTVNSHFSCDISYYRSYIVYCANVQCVWYRCKYC